MIMLDKPVNVNVTGESTDGTAIVTVRVAPLPVGDKAVTPILKGLNISVDEECLVQIKSKTTVLYERKFAGAGSDVLTDVRRECEPTIGMKLFVTGCGGSNVTRLVADIGYEYNGGAMASGGTTWPSGR